jgi:hypothetical protein
MENFKSDNIDTEVTNSFIPVGGIVTKVGSFSEYSNSEFIDVGLIPCDGRSLNTYEYRNLHAIIGNIYGGSSFQDGITNVPSSVATFNLPNLSDIKLFTSHPNTELVGSTTISSGHTHLAFSSSSTPSVNAATNTDSYTHSHGATFNTGNQVTNHDGHNAGGFGAASGAPTSGLRSKASGNLTAASVGHTHNTFNVNPGGVSAASLNANHAHNNPTINTNSSTIAEGSHSHTTTFNSTSTSGTSSSFAPPHYSVLYFIRS